MNKKAQIERIVILLLVSVAISYSLVRAIAEELRVMPKGPFIIAKKEVGSQGWFGWLFGLKAYLFFNDVGGCVEVSEFDYERYDVGEWFPNDYTIL